MGRKKPKAPSAAAPLVVSAPARTESTAGRGQDDCLTVVVRDEPSLRTAPPVSLRPHNMRIYLHPDTLQRLNLVVGAFVWVRAARPLSDQSAAPHNPNDAAVDTLAQAMTNLSVETEEAPWPAIAWVDKRVAVDACEVPQVFLENARLDQWARVWMLDEREAAALPRATAVTLQTPWANESLRAGEMASLAAALVAYRVVRVGMSLRLWAGGRERECQIASVESVNEGMPAYRLNRDVALTLTCNPKRKSSTAVGPEPLVGGLDTELAQLRDLLVNPILHPERFESLGLEPPRSALLVGDAGTGKTLVAHALAHELGARLFTVSEGDVASRHVGESEERLRALWADAERASVAQPAVLLLEQLDTLGPARGADRSGGVGELGRRLVATLVALLDAPRLPGSRLVVIAATSRPSMVDAALRRPGRLDREVELPVPNKAGRLAILNCLFATVRHDFSGIELAEAAGAAHGYVGADLAQLVREAGLAAVRDGAAAVSSAHLTVALRRVLPSAMRDSALDISPVRWADIGGQAETKARLREAVEWPLRHPDAFARFAIQPPKGVLLYGPPGCSKTMLARALATECGLNFIAVKGPELFNKFVGESERGVRDVFRRARRAAPSIVFFDEIDALAVRRAGSEASVGDRVLTQLLTEMDGVERLTGVTIVAATNRPDILDPALVRPGRIDRLVYVGPPDAAAREQIFARRLSGMSVDSSVSAVRLAELSAGFSGAECAAVCQEAALRALEESIDAPVVAWRHFERACGQTRPQITREMLEFYAKFQSDQSRVC